MRIIAGEARGRRIKAPDTRDTRPATDRVREAVFSSLGDLVVDARVADLYAGSGSFGLEALSRGAASVVFVENGRKALKALESNITAVGLGGALVRGTVKSFLGREEGDQFDLVFMDPPWDQPNLIMEEEMRLLDRQVAAGGNVIVSRRSVDAEPTPPETWRVATEKRYGDTRIFRYQKLETDHDDGTLSG